MAGGDSNSIGTLAEKPGATNAQIYCEGIFSPPIIPPGDFALLSSAPGQAIMILLVMCPIPMAMLYIRSRNRGSVRASDVLALIALFVTCFGFAGQALSTSSGDQASPFPASHRPWSALLFVYAWSVSICGLFLWMAGKAVKTKDCQLKQDDLGGTRAISCPSRRLRSEVWDMKQRQDEGLHQTIVQ